MSVPRDCGPADLGQLSKVLRGYKTADPQKAAEQREAEAKFRHALRNKGHVGAWKEIEGRKVAAREAENNRRADNRMRGAMDAISSELHGNRKHF